MTVVAIVPIPVMIIAIEVEVVSVVVIVLVRRRTPIVTVRTDIVRRRPVAIARSRRNLLTIIYTKVWRRVTLK